MTLSGERSLSYVVERDIDLVILQLLQTSSKFRDWFVTQLDLVREVDEFLGVRHSVTTKTGESDIEVGFETSDGDNYLVLIENKIDAALQDRQVERYFERGNAYLERDEWDAFSVCLIAPENYTSKSQIQLFDKIILYEDILKIIGELNHDGSPFFSKAFKQSLTKHSPADNTEVTSAIRRKTLSKLRDLQDICLYQVSNTMVRLESTHGRHPSLVLYNTYVPGPDDGNKTIVRINLTGKDDGTEANRERALALFSEKLPTPDGFELTDRPMDIVRKDIYRSDFSSDEAYIDDIATELSGLVEFYHPLLIQEPTR